MDREKFIQHLKSSGIPFTDAEIEAEADAAVKDAKAKERRTILNTQKVEAAPVAESSPAIAAAAAPPVAAASAPAASMLSVPTAPAGTTSADLVTGKVVPSGMGLPPEQRVGAVGQTVVDAGGNLVQNAVDYFSTFPNYHPNITGAALAVPIAYAAHKAAQATGLYDTLISKMATNNASAQPQPFVGGSGPRNTPPAPVVTPTASPIQNWDIHNEPDFFAPALAAPTEAAPAAPVNTKLEELKARAAAGTPTSAATVAPEAAVPAMTEAPKPVAPTPAKTSAAMPSRPVTPTPAAALPTGEPVPPVLSQRVQNAITGVPKAVQDQYAKEGKVVLKGYGVGDRSITNTYGIPAYQKIIDYFNNGQPIGDDANYQIIRKKINQGVPASLAAEFAAKLPGSEEEAGNFGKAFGETGAYTKEGKVVTSPAAMKKAVAGGGALFLATALPNIVYAAQRGDKGPLLETAFDVGVGAIPVVGAAAQAMMGTNVGAPTVRSEPFAEVLQRPGVRQVLQNMSQTMSPSEFNVARDQYLSKLSSFPEYNSLRFTKPMIGSNQPINRRTLLPVAPPTR